MLLRDMSCWVVALGSAILLLSGCNRPADLGITASSAQATSNKGTPATATASQAVAGEAFADLYGDQGGEEVLPASSDSQAALLRARKGDTFFKLSNPRFEPVGKKPFPFLAVDYERVHDGPYGGQSLVVRAADGRDRAFLLIGPFADRAGTIEIDLGISPPGAPGPPREGEMYLTRQEGRYGNDFHPTFKVSNSVVMGTTRFPLSLARNWTPDEAAKLRNPPPEGPKPNAHPEAGEETDYVGDAGSAGKFRYAEPGKPVIGVDYWSGEWDKEPCLARLVPIYERTQSSEGPERLLAKPGYAIGGITVRTKRYVNAVQVVFMKLTPDGKLDPKDSYTSKWLGNEKVGTKEVKLGGDGRLVIGLSCQQGAILNAVALVLETGGK